MGRREELGARIRDAVDKHSNDASHNEMSQAFFGMDVAAHEGVDPYPAEIVRGWMYGTTFPSLETLRAIAAAADFDSTRVGVAWLVYGPDYTQCAVEHDDFLRYFRRENTAARDTHDERAAPGL